MSRRHLFCFLIAVSGALILLTAGCFKLGPDSASTNSANVQPAGPPKPCSLITQAEVESALGKGASMNSGTNPRTGVEECTLSPAHATDLDHLILVVHDTTPESWEKLKKSYAQDQSVKPIPGLGDDALNVGMYGVWVRKGNVYMQIFGAINSQRDEKAELYLAERAVSRL
jgi:hypothetical protein